MKQDLAFCIGQRATVSLVLTQLRGYSPRLEVIGMHYVESQI